MENLRNSFENFLAENQYQSSPKGLFVPINYILNLKGKRFRPILLLAAYRAYQSDVAQAMPAAMSVEVFHNFTLLHDDIMDQAPLRRGHASVHKKYDTNTAILSGDAMMISAYQWLENYASHPLYGHIIATFSQVAMDVCRGQQMDMDFEKSWSVTVADYLEMIKLKTAVLLGGALKIGSLIGGASLADADQFYEFGISAGLAFQIQDDILDSFGDGALIGKQPGGDILQNKKTFLLLKTLSKVGNQQKIIDFLHTESDSSTKINYIKERMISSGALDDADLLRDDYYENSLTFLDNMSISQSHKDFFSDLALRMARRSF